MADGKKTPETSGKKAADIRKPTEEETARFGELLQSPTGEDVDFYGAPVQIATLADIQKYASTVPRAETARLQDIFGDPDKKKHSAIAMLLKLTDGDINPASIAKAHRLIDEAAARFMQHKESGAPNTHLILSGELEADTPDPFGNGEALARRFSKVTVTEPESGNKGKKTPAAKQRKP